MVVISILDLVIIYLALGAPVAVFLYSRAQGSLPFKILILAHSVIGWPIYGILYLYRRAKTSQNNSQPSLRHQIECIQTRLEKKVVAETSGVGLFELRDVLYRYCGLLDLRRTRSDRDPRFRLFEAVSHPNVRLASICYQRQAVGHIDFHHQLVRSELIEVAQRIWLVNRDESVLDDLKQIAVIVDDAVAIEMLEKVMAQDFGSAISSEHQDLISINENSTTARRNSVLNK